jgi:hypothetical protein
MFLVVGSSGEYDEYRTWPVVAFAERSTAATYAELATKWSIEGRAAYCEIAREWHWEDSERWVEKHPSPYDKESNARDAARYTVVEVPVREMVPLILFRKQRVRRKHKSGDEA